MSEISADLLYTKEHEWILVDEDVATIGISDHAQAELGDITFVELPEEEMEVNIGDEAANIESVKAASPIYAPLSGTIVEVNSDLDDTPESINHDPYGAGWVFRIEFSNKAELEDLMDAEAYKEFLAEEEDGDDA